MKLYKGPTLEGISCPACGTKAMIRTSVQITETAREIRAVCSDFDNCDMSFVLQSVVTHVVRPSKKPTPSLSLPIGNQNLRKLPKPETAPEPDLFSLLPPDAASSAALH